MQKLLVVSHDDITGNHIRKGLANGFDVHQTSTVEQALAFAIEHKPNGIIIDFAMPRMSGIELCQSLRGITYTSRIPIFARVEKSSPGASVAKEDLGVTSLFEQPIEMEEIKTRLNFEREGQHPQRRAHV